ncbi:hypothetical protein ACHAXM_002745, partial [Skeletonema potamos]
LFYAISAICSIWFAYPVNGGIPPTSEVAVDRCRTHFRHAQIDNLGEIQKNQDKSEQYFAL